MNVSDQVSGSCACGWFPPSRDPMRKAQAHASLTGHTVTVTIVRTIIVKGGER